MVIEHQEMWWNIIPWICSFQFIERSQTFLSNVPAFIAQNWKKTKEVFFWTTLFSSKCSLELIDWSFVIPADFVCRKSKLFFALNPKFFKKHLFVRKIFFFQNDPQRSKKAISTNLPKHLCQKSRKLTKRVIEPEEMRYNLIPWKCNF